MELKDLAIYHIIKKLDRMGKWGGLDTGQHTEERNLIKGMPDILIRSKKGKKSIEKAKKELENKGWIIKRKKTGEWHYWLNLSKEKEILEFKNKMNRLENNNKNNYDLE